MAFSSENELKFLRLLQRTQRLTKENLSANVWKVSAATKILTNLVGVLQIENKNNRLLSDYRQQVLQLSLLAEAESKNSTEESLKIVEKIPRVFADVPIDSDAHSVKSNEKESSSGLRAVQRSIYRSDLRRQLLSTKKNKVANTSADEAFIKNERLEEDISNELFKLTRALKTVQLGAQGIIKDDLQTVDRMRKQVEDNKNALETENARLEHHAYKMSTTPGTPHGVTHGLMEQGWYWADADRATVSKALYDQPDGSFIVRNASTPGDYTLSVKFGGQVKLLRIVINEGRCGFNLDSLVHDSVVQLVEFHRNISLNIFNDALDVRLMFPVSVRRNSQSGRPLIIKKGTIQQRMILSAKNDHDWRERLELENLRAVHLAFERGAKLYDSAHQEMERAESLYHALNQSVRDNEIKLAKLKDLLEVETEVVTEVQESKSTSEMFKKVFANNKTFLQESIRRIGVELTSSIEKKKTLSGILDEIALKRANSKARLCKLMELRNAVYDQMDPSLCTKMATMLDAGAELINNENTKVTQLLVDMELKWTPAQYLMCGTSKENAANALVHARYRIAQLDKAIGLKREPIDGIFLVRGSSSHGDKLVLSVLHGERVSHCLIEQNEEGWGFERSNVYLTTISDFIRYYTQFSLETHADAIKTPLRMPAFDAATKDTTNPLRNGPGQLFTPLPLSKKYMEEAMLRDDPTAPIPNYSPEPKPDDWKSSSPEKPDSLPVRPTSLPETIPE
ncbi:unnamed protein product [Caenorhabditis sp. 36 PRJEB53466]|nr:unnamed protein product [Caenorhabditis sp. 36 PRJEB53466]